VFSVEERYALAKECIETCFGADAVAPFFTVEILSTTANEEIRVHLKNAYMLHI
jgi:hypothetical protein